MKPIAIIGLVVVGVFMFNRLEAAGTAQQLRFQIDDIGLSIGWLNTEIRLKIKVQNPTSGSFTINSFAGDAYINDNYIGNISSFTPFTVLPNSQNVYPVVAAISNLSIPGTIVDLVQNWKSRGATISADATINIDNLSLPITISSKLV